MKHDRPTVTAAHYDPYLRFLSGSSSVEAVVVITAPTAGDGVEREEEVGTVIEDTNARTSDLLMILHYDEGLMLVPKSLNPGKHKMAI